MQQSNGQSEAHSAHFSQEISVVNFDNESIQASYSLKSENILANVKKPAPAAPVIMYQNHQAFNQNLHQGNPLRSLKVDAGSINDVGADIISGSSNQKHKNKNIW